MKDVAEQMVAISECVSPLTSTTVRRTGIIPSTILDCYFALHISLLKEIPMFLLLWR